MSEIGRILERKSEETERFFSLLFCCRKFCIMNGWAEDKKGRGKFSFRYSEKRILFTDQFYIFPFFSSFNFFFHLIFFFPPIVIIAICIRLMDAKNKDG
jgi:hypothetical protein